MSALIGSEESRERDTTNALDRRCVQVSGPKWPTVVCGIRSKACTSRRLQAQMSGLAAQDLGEPLDSVLPSIASALAAAGLYSLP